MYPEQLAENILNGQAITRSEALRLYEEPLSVLCEQADRIRRHFLSDRFDLCTIVNGKNGHCSENCKFCAQSSFYHTEIREYPLMKAEELLAHAKRMDRLKIPRYSIVTSGKRLSDREVEQMCDVIRQIRSETSLSVCVSFGLLNLEQYRKLKAAGVSRIHNNLETSRRNFPNVCTTHSFEEKVTAIRAAMEAGLTVCSGGIMGLGETVEDRVDLAFELKALGIRSVPINLLNPIPGTPYACKEKLTAEELQRIIAVFRFILPDAFLRLAGGRGLLEDHGTGCFLSGANAAITGDMLTTAGITVETDFQLLKNLGYEVEPGHE